jgi:hypothetical protein
MRLALTALLAAASLTAAPLPDAGRPAFEGLSDADRARVRALEEGLFRTRVGRRLLAETRRVERRAVIRDARGIPVAWTGGEKPFLAFDSQALAHADMGEAELAFARELSLASMAVSFDMPEAAMAARQNELSFAVETAQADPAFSKRLRAAFNKERARLDAVDAPPGELARAARDLALFEKGPDIFYRAVERETAGAASVRLTELEDFWTLYGPSFSAVKGRADEPYVRAGGRRYPSALLKAAKSLQETGGLPRVKEALGDFEGGPAQDLTKRLRAWLSRAS